MASCPASNWLTACSLTPHIPGSWKTPSGHKSRLWQISFRPTAGFNWCETRFARRGLAEGNITAVFHSALIRNDEKTLQKDADVVACIVPWNEEHSPGTETHYAGWGFIIELFSLLDSAIIASETQSSWRGVVRLTDHAHCVSSFGLFGEIGGMLSWPKPTRLLCHVISPSQPFCPFHKSARNFLILLSL